MTGSIVAQPKSECVAAHADAQVLRKHEALTEARAKLALCAHKTCPALVQKDCTQWLAEVEAGREVGGRPVPRLPFPRLSQCACP